MNKPWKTKEFWVNQLGEDWAIRLKSVLRSEYMDYLMSLLKDKYSKETIFPLKKNIFRAFRETSWKDTKVVLLSQSPYHYYLNGTTTPEATGLSFSNIRDPEGTMIDIAPSLRSIELNLLKSYHSDPSEFLWELDYSLESWAKQGILLLNSALTVKEGQPDSHQKLWEPFTAKVLEALNTNKSGVIFLLWGRESQKFKKYLSTKNQHILEYEHPAAASYKNKSWNCPHFKEVNQILENMNQTKIKW